MKKKQSKLFEKKVPILNDEYFVYVIWGDVNKARNFVNSYYCGDFSVDTFFCRGKCFYQKDLHPVIWLNSKKHKWATLAHEAVHAVRFIWDYLDEDYIGEPFAHSVGAIVYALERKDK